MNIPLRFQVTPLTLPRTLPQPIKRRETKESSGLPVEIVIYPDEIAEMAIQVENLTPHALSFSPRIEGTFPQQWYRLVRTDDKFFPLVILQLATAKLDKYLFLFLKTYSSNIYLIPRGKADIIVQWKIPKDFFEISASLRNFKSLILDYNERIILDYQYIFSPLGLIIIIAAFFLSLADGQDSVAALWIKTFLKTYRQSKPFNLYIRPDSLYLNFLPEIYRQIDFLGRFLSIFEQTFEPDVNLLDSLWGYFNPMLTSEAFLPFLSHWVGWTLTPALTLGQQRYLVRQAMELYRWRGTKKGLRLYLHLYTGLPLDEKLPETEKHITIEECFGERFIIGQTEIGHQAFIGGGQAYHFKVRLTSLVNQFLDENFIRQIIEQEKPSFCTYELTLINR